MAQGRGKTEHAGPRDMSRKSGHWGFTEEAKAWASRARRRDEKRELADEVAADDGTESPEHPMLPYLVDLELVYDPSAHRDYDAVELVRYALTGSDYWADLAMGWLEQGIAADPVVQELRALEARRHRPQRLRHRARRLLNAIPNQH